MKVKDYILELFRGNVGETFVVLRAEIIEGKLTISGQDFGPMPKKIFGDYEYEYFYSLDEINTDRLFQLIKFDDFVNELSNSDACEKFRKICQSNGIHYDFYTF